jgi:hypothetical protein
MRKQKITKIQKQEKENCFANLKEREDSSGVTSPSLGDCTTRDKDLVSMNSLCSMKLAVVNAFLCSPTMAPENILDDTKHGANLLGLQV